MRAILGQIPVAANLHFALAIFHQVPGGQFMNAPKGTVRIRNISEIKILQQAFGINLRQIRMHRQ